MTQSDQRDRGTGFTQRDAAEQRRATPAAREARACRLCGVDLDELRGPDGPDVLHGREAGPVIDVPGHPAACSAEHALDRFASDEVGPATVYALDLLAWLSRADTGLAHPERELLIRHAEATLRKTLGELVSDRRAASPAGRGQALHRPARSRIDAQSLRDLGDPGDPGGAQRGTIVEVRCAQCPTSALPADRYLDPFGVEEVVEEAGLCAWHAHLEAMLRARQRRAATVGAPAERTRRAASGDSAVGSTRRQR